MNPDFELRILDIEQARSILSDRSYNIENVPSAALSDILRARLLAQHGGVWADASVLCLQPLDAWLWEDFSNGFFAFDRPGSDRALSSWFLAVESEHVVMQKWAHLVDIYWSTPRRLKLNSDGSVWIPDDPTGLISEQIAGVDDTYPYFWFHYLFGYLISTDEKVSNIWSKRKILSAKQAHELQAMAVNRDSLSSHEVNSLLQISPLQKLNWRSLSQTSLARQVGEAAFLRKFSTPNPQPSGL